MLRLSNIRHWPTERISQRVLYLLIALAAVVFVLFYGIGYDRPFADNPNFNAPLFTDLLLSLILVLTVLAGGLSIWAVVRSVRKLRGSGNGIENNVPAARISRSVILGTIGIVVFSFLVASGREMLVNGRPYGDWFWLKVSDMFIYTSVILLLVTIAAAIYGATKYYRGARK